MKNRGFALFTLVAVALVFGGCAVVNTSVRPSAPFLNIDGFNAVEIKGKITDKQRVEELKKFLDAKIGGLGEGSASLLIDFTVYDEGDDLTRRMLGFGAGKVRFGAQVSILKNGQAVFTWPVWIDSSITAHITVGGMLERFAEKVAADLASILRKTPQPSTG
ncbi:MAG: hypothetical protein HYW89_01920 [Candidatus Sungiibacteriota bacterium]|uniref:DUF4410 domain-containing protein n=1 Tax=Candidatus Sungiibacteriota bacterium TaxID=2750080 RepID=A0A7T5UR03_9BACT|nr:MAG: hypothetical protein HYW89_01920 [Candidatus Sungbacteria bacterium]